MQAREAVVRQFGAEIWPLIAREATRLASKAAVRRKMKRQVAELRRVLLAVESGEVPDGDEVFDHHAWLLADGEFLHGISAATFENPLKLLNLRMTAKGADLLDDLRSEALLEEAVGMARLLGIDPDNLWLVRRYVRARAPWPAIENEDDGDG